MNAAPTVDKQMDELIDALRRSVHPKYHRGEIGIRGLPKGSGQVSLNNNRTVNINLHGLSQSLAVDLLSRIAKHIV